MKILAAAFGTRPAKMMRPADAERLTGYHVGRHQPVRAGGKKRAGCGRPGRANESSVFLNGGQRGLQIELDPNDARKALDARVAALVI